MKQLVFIVGLLVGLAFTFGSPPSPQPIAQNGEYAHFDVQVHSRDNNTWGDNALESMMAEHGTDCSAPPSTHENHSYSGAVYICNNHVMTAINAQGYGEIALTPSQLLDCTVVCSVTFDISTERLSTRDWPDVWLTPWNDNLVLPFDAGDVDLQGGPRQGVHLNAAANENGWHCTTIANYVETDLGCPYYVPMDYGVAPGTNEAAVRQTFQLTLTTGHIRFERIASATAPQITFIDAGCACLMVPDYVVQFAHHSYNPTKDNSGVPATWHWSGFALNPAVPFTLIHSTPRMVATNNSVINFNSPAPAGAYLRFSAVCRVLIDGVLSTRQTFLGHPEHASDYFIPVAQGKTGVNVTFLADDWYSGPCALQDAAVWAKGSAPSTPTPTPVAASSTATPTSTLAAPTASPSSTPTSTAIPSTPTIVLPTPTMQPVSTSVVPSPTNSPSPQTQVCTLRWGSGTVKSYGPLTLAQCLARTN